MIMPYQILGHCSCAKSGVVITYNIFAVHMLRWSMWTCTKTMIIWQADLHYSELTTQSQSIQPTDYSQKCAGTFPTSTSLQYQEYITPQECATLHMRSATSKLHITWQNWRIAFGKHSRLARYMMPHRYEVEVVRAFVLGVVQHGYVTNARVVSDSSAQNQQLEKILQESCWRDRGNALKTGFRSTEDVLPGASASWCSLNLWPDCSCWTGSGRSSACVCRWLDDVALQSSCKRWQPAMKGVNVPSNVVWLTSKQLFRNYYKIPGIGELS